jgi:hypothetical protein
MSFLAVICGFYLAAAPAGSNGFLSGPQTPQTVQPVQPPSTTTPPLPSSEATTPPSDVEATPDVCQNLKNKSHIDFAALLTGNERILFCSIFDETMRNQTLTYMSAHPQIKPSDAVIQIAKDAGLIFNQTPGGACGAH